MLHSTRRSAFRFRNVTIARRCLSDGPSRFHFIRLEPNYDHYWGGDSDATTSLSNHELYLWIKTWGDTCVNCPPEARLTLRDPPLPYLIIQKSAR